MNRLEVLKRAGIEPGTPVDVAGSVAFGEGAIVSRALLRSPAGSLTAFAFDAGQELSTHTAPFEAVLHVLEGRLRVTVGGRSVEAPAGSLVVLPSGVPHAVEALARSKALLTMLRAIGG
jgi:quercetin dioxygenase-like cupin family protein